MKTLITFMVILFLVYNAASQDNALDFDGVNQYVSVNYHADLNPTVFTVSLWAKVEGGQGTKWSAITSQNISATNEGYAIYVNDQNEWTFWIGTGAGSESISWSVDTFNEWVNIVGKFDGSNLVMYANGIKVAEQTGISDLTPNALNNLFIGSGGNTGNESYFNGMMDEVSIWKVTLTDQTLRYAYLDDFVNSDPDLTAYYWMNFLNNETTLFDRAAVGDKNNGTVMNMSSADLFTSPVFYGPQLALSFDGVDDYVDISSGAFQMTSNQYTQEVWVYPTHLSTDVTDRYIFGCDESLPDIDRPPVVALQGENLKFGFGNGNAYLSDEATGVISLNTWNHIAVTFSGTKFNVYVNGIRVFVDNVGQQTPSSNPVIYLGRRGASECFQGFMDEARIWTDNVNAEVNIFAIDQSTLFTINSGQTFITNELLFIREELINNGTNQMRGVGSPGNSNSIYNDNGSTEYVGSDNQIMEYPEVNNLVINNSGGSVITSLDSDVLTINSYLNIQQGTFVSPGTMNVGGIVAVDGLLIIDENTNTNVTGGSVYINLGGEVEVREGGSLTIDNQ